MPKSIIPFQEAFEDSKLTSDHDPSREAFPHDHHLRNPLIGVLHYPMSLIENVREKSASFARIAGVTKNWRLDSMKPRRWLAMIALFATFIVLAVSLLAVIWTDNAGNVTAQATITTTIVEGIPTPTDNEWYGTDSNSGTDSAMSRVPDRITVSIERSPLEQQTSQSTDLDTAAWREYADARGRGDQVAYVRNVDRVVYAPDGVNVHGPVDDPIFGKVANMGCPPAEHVVVERCPSYPVNWLYRGDWDEDVVVDADGHVYNVNSPALPDGFTFLSEFPYHCIAYRSSACE